MTSDNIKAGPQRFILMTVLLSAIGLGIVAPTLPQLIQEIQGSSLSEAAAMGAWIGAIYALFQFLLGPLMGNLSDKFGRRPVLLLAVFGFGVDHLLMGFAPAIGWLFLGRMIAGGLGSIFSPANAAIADITTKEDRAASFGKVLAAFGIGFMIGPALGGLLGEFGPRIPFFVAGILAIANATYGFFVFPETLEKSQRRDFQWRLANPVGAFINLSKTDDFISIAWLFFIWALAVSVTQVLWPYFSPLQYGWSTGMVGISIMFFCISMTAIQSFLIKPFVAHFGERYTAMISIMGGITVYAFFAFLTNGTIAIVVCLFVGVHSVAAPCISAIMSKRVGEDQQGELQGFNGSASALAMLAAYLMYLPLLEYFTSEDRVTTFAGAPFLLAIMFALIALIILVFMKAEKHIARE